MEFRHSVRALHRAPGFTAAAVLTLALGIGANTALFSILDALVLRPLDVRHPEQLVQLAYTTPAGSRSAYFSYPEFEAARQVRSLTDVFGGHTVGRVNLVVNGDAGLAQAQAYSPNFFAALGFDGLDLTSNETVAVLSDRYWRARFSADPSIVGARVTINQVPFTIRGIAPRGFDGVAVGSGADLWVPLRSLDLLAPDTGRWTGPQLAWIHILGRLRPGATLAAAEAELAPLHRPNSRIVLRMVPAGMPGWLRATYETPLRLLLAIAAAVLVTACANVANLQLARAAARRRETEIRIALGATRWRIVRGQLLESLLLAIAGGALALPISWWGAEALLRVLSSRTVDLAPDWRIFAFAAALSLAAGALFGLFPALRGSRSRVLVVVQVTLSVVLVAGAGLFVRTLQQLWRVDAGYDRENVLLFSVDTKLAGYSHDRSLGLYDRILERVRTVRGVRAAAVSLVRPADDYFSFTDRIDELPGQAIAWNSVSPGYFAALATPIIAGRDFTLHDHEAAPRVVIVNERLASRAFPGENSLGRRIGPSVIVGVVKDGRYAGPREDVRPTLYYPLAQFNPAFAFASFELRGAPLVDDIRRTVASVDRNLPIFRVRTVRAQWERSLESERLLAIVSAAFGALALVLACVGLYGLMSYAVARRTKEIGIRMALGARSGNVARMVLRETLSLTLAGVALGVPLAVASARFAATLLYGIGPADPIAIGVTVVALLAVALAAAYLPARRAIRIDPMTALRSE